MYVTNIYKSNYLVEKNLDQTYRYLLLFQVLLINFDGLFCCSRAHNLIWKISLRHKENPDNIIFMVGL